MRISTCILLLIVPTLCFAQEELDDDRKILKRREVNAAMSEPVYRRLASVHEQMADDKLNEALDFLRKLEKQRLSKYEKALVLQTFGFVYAQQSEEVLAIRSFEQSLETKSLPAQAHQGMLFSLAGLYASEMQFLKSIETAREWFRYEAAPKSDAYMLIASSFAELERFDDALPYVLKAISKADKPRKAWYMLALAIHLQKQRFKKAASLLVKMLEVWPDEARYWEMLAGCYLELGNDKQALDTMMLSYTNGILSGSTHILALARLSLMRDMPFTAGVIVETEIAKGRLESNEDNLKILLQSWLSAREYDRAAEVVKQLSPYAKDGVYFLQAAQIYYETGIWEKVIDNAGDALEAGLKKPAEALLLQGTAYVELGRYRDATRAFERAGEIGDKQHRRNSESWIEFIKEKDRLRDAAVSAN